MAFSEGCRSYTVDGFLGFHRSLTVKAARIYDGTSRPWQHLLVRRLRDRLKQWLLTILLVSFLLRVRKVGDRHNCRPGSFCRPCLRSSIEASTLRFVLRRRSASGVSPLSGACRDEGLLSETTVPVPTRSRRAGLLASFGKHSDSPYTVPSPVCQTF